MQSFTTPLPPLYRALICGLTLACGLAQANESAPSPAARAAAAAAAEASQERPAVAEARVSVQVSEDDSNRIEETRVRGQTQKVTVQPKNSKLPGYEIIMGDGGRDLSASPGSARTAVGQRVWNVIKF